MFSTLISKWDFLQDYIWSPKIQNLRGNILQKGVSAVSKDSFGHRTYRSYWEKGMFGPNFKKLTKKLRPIYKAVILDRPPLGTNSKLPIHFTVKFKRGTSSYF